VRLRFEQGLTANTDVLLWRTRQLLESTDGSGNALKPPRSPIASEGRKRGGKSGKMAPVHPPRSSSELAAQSRADGHATFEEEPLASDEDNGENANSPAQEGSWHARRGQETVMTTFETGARASNELSNVKGNAAENDDGRNLNKVSRKALDLLLSGALDEVMDLEESM